MVQIIVERLSEPRSDFDTLAPDQAMDEKSSSTAQESQSFDAYISLGGRLIGPFKDQKFTLCIIWEDEEEAGVLQCLFMIGTEICDPSKEDIQDLRRWYGLFFELPLDEVPVIKIGWEQHI